MKRLNDNSDLLKILRCAFETYNTLKSGYLESVYEAALEYELLQAGFSVSRQVRIPVFYKGVELRKDLGFGVQTLRLQKTAVPLRLLS